MTNIILYLAKMEDLLRNLNLVTILGLGFRVLYYPRIMENQMKKKMENEMETGGI